MTEREIVWKVALAHGNCPPRKAAEVLASAWERGDFGCFTYLPEIIWRQCHRLGALRGTALGEWSSYAFQKRMGSERASDFCRYVECMKLAELEVGRVSGR